MGVPGLMEELLEKLQRSGVFSAPSLVGFVGRCDQDSHTLHFYVLEHPSMTVLMPVPGLMACTLAHLFLATDHAGASSWTGRFVELVPKGLTTRATWHSAKLTPLLGARLPNWLKTCDIS